MVNLDQLVETVKQQMQPPPRAMATANTLQQLSASVPDDVTVADLVVGWQILSRPSGTMEEPPTLQRRVTCGELAALATPFMDVQGDLAQAVRAWQAWVDAFKQSDDPRHMTMAKTFTRELAELQRAHP